MAHTWSRILDTGLDSAAVRAASNRDPEKKKYVKKTGLKEIKMNKIKLK